MPKAPIWLVIGVTRGESHENSIIVSVGRQPHHTYILIIGTWLQYNIMLLHVFSHLTNSRTVNVLIGYYPTTFSVSAVQLELAASAVHDVLPVCRQPDCLTQTPNHV